MPAILIFINLNFNVMKRFASLIVAAMLVACCLVSCKQNTPSAIAADCIESVKAGDYKAFVDTFDMTDEDKAQLTQVFEQKGKETIEKAGGIQGYEIIEENISEDGAKATVKSKITYGNGDTDDSTFAFAKVDGEWKQVLEK